MDNFYYKYINWKLSHSIEDECKILTYFYNYFSRLFLLFDLLSQNLLDLLSQNLLRHFIINFIYVGTVGLKTRQQCVRASN